MTRRVRTTKSLAKRMDLQYFTRLHPLRRWRLYLSIAVPLVAVIWFTSQRARGEKVYSSGPLSAAHAAFGKKCELCHVTRGGVFRKEVDDAACLACHDAPSHHPTLVSFTPTCGSCHVEHKSALRLAHTTDSACAQCHADLKLKSGEPRYDRQVSNFDRHHPEFAALRTGAKDPGAVKLNHYVHLQPKLASPNGPVQMRCQDCHRTAGEQVVWPYALAETKPCPAEPNANPAAVATVSSVTFDVRRDPKRRAYMSTITYAAQCAGCHVKDLQFDKRFSESVPHCKPDVVQAFLLKKYTDYIATHPNALSEPLRVSKIPSTILGPMPPAPHTREEWIAWQVTYADRLLFNKGCKLCHTMLAGEGAIPQVAKTSVPARWMQHADFDHDAHRMMTCTSCHSRTPQSRETADILLPGIATCRGCHQEGGAQHDAADARCSECHLYHDWRKEKSPRNNFTIPQLRSSAAGF